MEKEKTVKSMMSELYRESYLNSYRVIVAGSRGFFDYDLMRRELDELFWVSSEFDDGDIKIISGMADGADSLAIRYADERKLTKILFPANWKKHHRIAQQVVSDAGYNVLIDPKGVHRITSSTIKLIGGVINKQ